jgi:hypothetical protein
VSEAPDLVLPLRSRRQRRAALVQKLQHAVPAIPLLFHGISALTEHAAGPALTLGVIEVVTSVVLLGAMLRAVRQLRSRAPVAHGHGHGIDWIDVFIAGVLAAEALERWHADHHVARPTILLAVVMLGLGLAHGRILAFGDRKRAMRVTADGLSIPRRPFGRLTLRWSELDRISVNGGEAVVHARDGRTRRIDLDDLENPREVVAALEEASRRSEAAAAAASALAARQALKASPL